VAFAPDGRTLAAGSHDGKVLLWDLGSGEKPRCLSGHRGEVASLAFSGDGTRLASGSADTTALIWDLSRPSRPPAGSTAGPQTDELLAALDGRDGAAAHRAICLLSEAGGTAVADLRRRLEPPPLPDPARVRRWLADLDSGTFRARERAFAELARRGDRVELALLRALNDGATLEKQRRIAKLLEGLTPDRSPGRLSVLRGVEALERGRTAQALQALEELARLPEDHLVAREARVALERLGRR
jgi:hypothetical protein